MSQTLPPAYPAAVPTHSPAAASATAAPADIPASFPPWDSPPQASYGWFVDAPPPRGPFFWPLVPAGYKLRQTPAAAVKPEEKSATPKAVPLGEERFSDLFEYAPQMAFGWFCAVPPPQPPFFWPALPEGYTLIRSDEVDTSLSVTNAVAPASAGAPHRQGSNIVINPLAASSTLPSPHPMLTPSIPQSMPMVPSPFVSSPPFIPPTAFTSPTPSATKQNDTSAPMDTSEGKAALKKGRGRQR